LRKATGEVHFIDFREKAPAPPLRNVSRRAGQRDQRRQHDRYKRSAYPLGRGLVYAEKKFGKLSLAKVMAPRFTWRATVSRSLGRRRRSEGWRLAKFRLRNAFPTRRQILPGARSETAELARTLERIAKNPDDFYHGAMARELAAAARKATV